MRDDDGGSEAIFLISHGLSRRQSGQSKKGQSIVSGAGFNNGMQLVETRQTLPRGLVWALTNESPRQPLPPHIIPFLSWTNTILHCGGAVAVKNLTTLSRLNFCWPLNRFVSFIGF